MTYVAVPGIAMCRAPGIKRANAAPSSACSPPRLSTSARYANRAEHMPNVGLVEHAKRSDGVAGACGQPHVAEVPVHCLLERQAFERRATEQPPRLSSACPSCDRCPPTRARTRLPAFPTGSRVPTRRAAGCCKERAQPSARDGRRRTCSRAVRRRRAPRAPIARSPQRRARSGDRRLAPRSPGAGTRGRGPTGPCRDGRR